MLKMISFIISFVIDSFPFLWVIFTTVVEFPDFSNSILNSFLWVSLHKNKSQFFFSQLTVLLGSKIF